MNPSVVELVLLTLGALILGALIGSTVTRAADEYEAEQWEAGRQPYKTAERPVPPQRLPAGRWGYHPPATSDRPALDTAWR